MTHAASRAVSLPVGPSFLARELKSKGYEPVLKHSRFLLLKRPENVTDKQDVKLDEPVTAGEAVTGGFWRVVPMDDERFGLFRHWENPEDGDEPFATLTDRDTALLAAAFLPLVDRARSFYVDPDAAAGPVLYRDGLLTTADGQR